MISCPNEGIIIVVNVFKLFDSEKETKRSVVVKIKFPTVPKTYQINYDETLIILIKYIW